MVTNVSKKSLDSIVEDIQKIDTDTILVVVDSRVWQLYSKEFEIAAKKIEGKRVLLYKSLEGEGTKNIEEFERGLEFFLEKGVHRKSHLIAIGGGATSDFGGYIASSLLRGIRWSVIPTTLLAMVDASIGGKTGINSKHGKNLIGSFHMPENVWIDEKFIETLPETEKESGLGEVVKYAFLSKAVFEIISRESVSLSQVIEACALEKEKIVQEDFRENGQRISLNLGHTFGHALERIYDLPHGVAVFWGMALIFKLWGKEEHLKKMRLFEESLKANFGQPPWLNKTFPHERIMDFVGKDKKVSRRGIVDIISIDEIGDFLKIPKEIEEIAVALRDNKDELRTFNF